MYMLSLIPRSCHPDSRDKIRMSSLRKWCWASAACCMMADLNIPGADWAVEKCSAFRAVAARADSPTYAPVQGTLSAPAQP